MIENEFRHEKCKESQTWILFIYEMNLKAETKSSLLHIHVFGTHGGKIMQTERLNSSSSFSVLSEKK